MALQMAFTCPACQEMMHVTELTCPECRTQVKGAFMATKFDRLNHDQWQFVEVFLRCRGNIKEVERELKISYPTVRSRLDQIITDMGYPVEDQEIDGFSNKNSDRIIDAFANGEMTFEETLQNLKGANQK